MRGFNRYDIYGLYRTALLLFELSVALVKGLFGFERTSGRNGMVWVVEGMIWNSKWMERGQSLGALDVITTTEAWLPKHLLLSLRSPFLYPRALTDPQGHPPDHAASYFTRHYAFPFSINAAKVFRTVFSSMCLPLSLLHTPWHTTAMSRLASTCEIRAKMNIQYTDDLPSSFEYQTKQGGHANSR